MREGMTQTERDSQNGSEAEGDVKRAVVGWFTIKTGGH